MGLFECRTADTELLERKAPPRQKKAEWATQIFFRCESAGRATRGAFGFFLAAHAHVDMAGFHFLVADDELEGDLLQRVFADLGDSVGVRDGRSSPVPNLECFETQGLPSSRGTYIFGRAPRQRRQRMQLGIVLSAGRHPRFLPAWALRW